MPAVWTLLPPQIAMYLLGSAFLGGAVVWLILGARSRRRLEQHADDWQGNVDDVVRARDRLIVEAESLRASSSLTSRALRFSKPFASSFL